MALSIYEAANRIIDDLVPKPIETLSSFSVKNSFSADIPTLERAYQIAEQAYKVSGTDGTGWLKEVNRLI